MDTDLLFQTLTANFVELGAVSDAPINRTLLVKDRFFVGHAFYCGEFHAIWKPDSTVIDFFDADGRLLRTVSLEQPQHRAAA